MYTIFDRIDVQGFLRSIIAAPADSTPRLIFADWLDENGGVDGKKLASTLRAQAGNVPYKSPPQPVFGLTDPIYRAYVKRLGEFASAPVVNYLEDNNIAPTNPQGFPVFTPFVEHMTGEIQFVFLRSLGEGHKNKITSDFLSKRSAHHVVPDASIAPPRQNFYNNFNDHVRLIEDNNHIGLAKLAMQLLRGGDRLISHRKCVDGMNESIRTNTKRFAAFLFAGVSTNGGYYTKPPLAIATVHDRKHIVKMLLDAGVEPDNVRFALEGVEGRRNNRSIQIILQRYLEKLEREGPRPL